MLTRPFLSSALLAAILTLLALAPAAAHELRPAFLGLKQTDAASYEVFWKVPSRGPYRLSLAPAFPADCNREGEAAEWAQGGFAVARWTLKCTENGLADGKIAIEGLEGTLTDALLRIEYLDGSVQSLRMTPSAPAVSIDKASGFAAVAGAYFNLGVEHILVGTDHLLFLAALILVAGTWQRIILTVTGFTLAHSLTLGLSALDLVRVPASATEAAIALSIVFLATEIARPRRDTLTWRYPVAVSSSFGLLHGFGFAAVLGAIGLPRTDTIMALLSFNLGVEAGQLVFVVALLAAGIALRRIRPVGETPGRAHIGLGLSDAGMRLAAYGVGILASVWLFERLASI